MKAILLIAHGSKNKNSQDEVKNLANILKEKTSSKIFEFAFLDVIPPKIPDGIKSCINQGANEVFILQHFLNTGNHVNDHIPQIIEEAKEQYPDIKFTLAPPIGLHKDIISLYMDLLN